MGVIPEKLQLFIGGYMGSSYSVELNDDTLVYTATTDGYKDIGSEELQPSFTVWAEFWNRLGDIEFWSWRGHYSTDQELCDGTHWSVVISKGDHVVEASGENAYPGSSCNPGIIHAFDEPTREFQIFCNAVCKLLGGRDFT